MEELIENMAGAIHAEGMMQSALTVEDHDAAQYFLSQFNYFYSKLDWPKTEITFKEL
jgi:hypothetical protein